MSRRRLLKTVGLASLGATLGSACAPRFSRVRGMRTPRTLARVNVSWDRVIRTVVGLRPARAGGFRVEAEKFDATTVIHNYGHDSRGVTLSWGTAHLAVEEARKTLHTRYAVIGCGVVGLTTARLLQRRGYDVTIYAKDLPPDTTSNVALATWGPVGLPPTAPSDYRERYAGAARFSHRYFQNLVGDDYGVHWRENYSDGGPARLARLKDDPFRDLYVDLQELGPEDHPFPATGVLRWLTLLIEPPVFLNALMRDFQLAGGRIVVREFPDLRSLLALPEPVLMNCTGLGARSLFNDQELIPRKGQLTVLPPQPEVDYIADIAGDMVSRKDGVLLGGTSEPNVWTLEPNQDAMRGVMASHMDFFNRMK